MQEHERKTRAHQDDGFSNLNYGWIAFLKMEGG
jgi:hypothetical protein